MMTCFGARFQSKLHPVISLLTPRVASVVVSLCPSFVGSHGRIATWILWDHVGVSSHRKPVNGFGTFCTSRDLTIKKCVPCNAKDLRPMTEESVNVLMPKVAGWNLVDENGTLKLSQSWKVKSFTKGLQLFHLVGDLAEAEGHHPDLHLVGWNNVKIEIWTHAVGGLTENDFILAAKINTLPMHELLRKKNVA